MYESTPFFYGTGRRKKSIARVRVYAGTGKIIINEVDLDSHLQNPVARSFYNRLVQYR